MPTAIFSFAMRSHACMIATQRRRWFRKRSWRGFATSSSFPDAARNADGCSASYNEKSSISSAPDRVVQRSPGNTNRKIRRRWFSTKTVDGKKASCRKPFPENN